jgi:hypothetical protein
MAHAGIPDFTSHELWVIQSTVKERYGREVPVEHAEAELRLNPEDRSVTPVPVAHWAERGARFVIFKLGDNRFRGQFYYRGFEQYGTGRDAYDDLFECVVTLLQVQADHERSRAEHPAGPLKPAEPPAATGGGPDLTPTIWD